MRRVIGPIMTTGVALVTAAVVVANPITVPHVDIQVPAVRLSSGTDETGGMLDKAFLDAIGPSPSVSDNPFAVLKLLVTSLAADATSLGKNAIVDAFVAGVTAVSQPELTAASSPYVSRPVDLPALTDLVMPGWDATAPVPTVPTPSATLPNPAAVVTEAAAPLVQEIVSSLVTDVGFVGTGLISAAFAAGALVATEPALIVSTVSALLAGNFDAALQSVVKAVAAPLRPPTILFEILRNVVENHLTDAAGPGPDSVDQSAATARATNPAAAVQDADAPASKPIARESRRNHRDVVLAAPQTPAPLASSPLASSPLASSPLTSLVPAPVAALGIAAARSAAAVSDAKRAPRATVGAAGEAITAISDQAGAAVEGVATAVGKIAGRSRGARAADRG